MYFHALESWIFFFFFKLWHRGTLDALDTRFLQPLERAVKQCQRTSATNRHGHSHGHDDADAATLEIMQHLIDKVNAAIGEGREEMA